jgi:hypothetical protein
MIYRCTLETEQEAKVFCSTLIHGGVYQKQSSGWVVWQLNS